MKTKKVRRRTPAKIEEIILPPEPFQSWGYFYGWNQDGSRQVIEDGVLTTPFVPERWHRAVYGGSKAG